MAQQQKYNAGKRNGGPAFLVAGLTIIALIVIGWFVWSVLANRVNDRVVDLEVTVPSLPVSPPLPQPSPPITPPNVAQTSAAG